MPKYWIFDADACTFERCDKQAALDADMPVIVSDGDVHVRIDGDSRRWPSGETLTVAGVQFDREAFEDAVSQMHLFMQAAVPVADLEIKALIDDERD